MKTVVPILIVLCAGIGWAQSRPLGVEPFGANLPAQKIGPNDLIAVSVYDAPELTRTVRVSADGMIRLPMVKRLIKAADLLPGDLELSIASALTAEQLFVNPVVTVTIAEYHSRPISVAGAVRNPITFQANGPLTLLDALTRAGGLSEEAGPEILVSGTQLRTDGESAAPVRRIPVRSLIDAADPGANLKLAGGEEIRVPEVGKVYVVGTVKKPGVFPLPSLTETTVLQMLALAEGLAPFASKQAYIYRLDPTTGSRNEIEIPLGKILARKATDIPVSPNDILYVPDNAGRRLTANAIEKIATFGTATASGILIWRH